jgi:hypothetical protein
MVNFYGFGYLTKKPKERGQAKKIKKMVGFGVERLTFRYRKIILHIFNKRNANDDETMKQIMKQIMKQTINETEVA